MISWYNLGLVVCLEHLHIYFNYIYLILLDTEIGLCPLQQYTDHTHFDAWVQLLDPVNIYIATV